MMPSSSAVVSTRADGDGTTAASGAGTSSTWSVWPAADAFASGGTGSNCPNRHAPRPREGRVDARSTFSQLDLYNRRVLRTSCLLAFTLGLLGSSAVVRSSRSSSWSWRSSVRELTLVGWELTLVGLGADASRWVADAGRLGAIARRSRSDRSSVSELALIGLGADDCRLGTDAGRWGADARRSWSCRSSVSELALIGFGGTSWGSSKSSNAATRATTRSSS
jgi:hypothetical protein